jgi:hypothetical protein
MRFKRDLEIDQAVLLEAYLLSSRTSASKCAKHLGVSKATFGTWLTGKFRMTKLTRVLVIHELLEYCPGLEPKAGEELSKLPLHELPTDIVKKLLETRKKVS